MFVAGGQNNFKCVSFSVFSFIWKWVSVQGKEEGVARDRFTRIFFFMKFYFEMLNIRLWVYRVSFCDYQCNQLFVNKMIPGEGNGNPLQYFCLENSMERRAWLATVHGVTKREHTLAIEQAAKICKTGNSTLEPIKTTLYFANFHALIWREYNSVPFI